MNMKTTIISLGGSIIVPEQINVDFLSQFRTMILDFVKQSDHRVVIICGGGYTNKIYNTAATKITSVSDVDLDWIVYNAKCFIAKNSSN